MSVLEVHLRLSSHREAFLEQVNELWKEHDEQTKNVTASLKEDAHAARLCAAAGLRQLAMSRNGDCAYLCAARWWHAVAKGAPYPGAEEGGRGVATLDYANPAKTVTVQKINTGVLSRFSGGRTSLVDSKTAITVGSGNAVCVLE